MSGQCRPSRSMAEVAAAVAAAAAANDGTAELAAATAAVLPGDFPVGPCEGINGFLSVIGAEPLLRSLNHAGRAGVAHWSPTRAAAARSVRLDQARAGARPSRARRAALSRSSARARAPPSRPQLGFDDARVEDASRNLPSAALAALAGDAGVGIKNARFKMLVRLVPRSEQKELHLGYARALERAGSLAGALTRASPPLPLAQRQQDRRRGRAGPRSGASPHPHHGPPPRVRARARSRGTGLSPAL